jgi:hypothetical protein
MVARQLSAVEQRQIDQFWWRKAVAAKLPRMGRFNATLPAGSPMFYHCKSCGWLIVLPELHVEPAPQHCDECDYLIAHALMPPPDSAPPSKDKAS